MGVRGQVKDSQLRESGKICWNRAVMYISHFPNSLNNSFYLPLFNSVAKRKPFLVENVLIRGAFALLASHLR
jgi:hypothetical protein